MAGYVGTEKQQALQKRTESAIDWMNSVPGACNPGRMLGSDDPDLLGWDTILDTLSTEGVVGFRMIPADAAIGAAATLASHGYRLNTWNVFLADRDAAMPAVQSVLQGGLPDGFNRGERPTDPEGVDLRAI
ncbi:MAG: hypothetical protein KF723_18685 [Rhizobiaceae bacterium]|nr:hypothetical protein [Rhizobiaceae bacterium]